MIDTHARIPDEGEVLFVGLDDTDTLESRGTGHLAREVAAALAAHCCVLGVTRHQLLLHPRIPYTAKNSSAAIHLQLNRDVGYSAVLERVKIMLRERFIPGSDPGLCVTACVPEEVVDFGRRAQRHVVTKTEAHALADQHGIPLLGLGGTEDGVIGAIAAVGLAASGNDGRYVLIGCSRALRGLQPISAVLAAGVAHVRTPDGHPVTHGLVLADKLRPARRAAQAVAVVEWCPEPLKGLSEGYWLPLKLD